MENQMNCLLCGHDSTVESFMDNEAFMGPTMIWYNINCPVCCEYTADHSFKAACGDNEWDSDLRGQLSFVSRYIYEFYGESLRVSKNYFDDFRKHGDSRVSIPVTVPEKFDAILKYLEKKTKFAGQSIELNKQTDKAICNADNIDEFEYLIYHLVQFGWITRRAQATCTITPKGWERLEKMKAVNADSQKCFVAMNFSPDYAILYDNAIKPAIAEAGYHSVRIDKKDGEDPRSDIKIDDRIIAEIKTARFLIVDYTGQRQDVYYESGFAKGLGLPVIRSCIESEIKEKKLSFDERNYPCLPWEQEKLEEFKELLKNRILAEIGKGTYRAESLSTQT